MTDYIVNGDDLSSVADAIRSKGGTTEPLEFPDGFARAVEDIPNSKSVQADYNVNDETDPAYIKNRPFFIGDSVLTELLPETTLQFEGNDTRAMAFFEVTPELLLETMRQNDQHYIVNWDGTEYEVTASPYMGEVPVLGNLSILNDEIGENTGEPFLFFYDDEPFVVVTNNTGTEHTFSVTGNIESVKKIDKKYLPDYPTSLKNPYALNFTGVVSETYDGSEEKTINIPVFQGATKNTSGKTGTVPAPRYGNTDSYLKSNGGWGIPISDSEKEEIKKTLRFTNVWDFSSLPESAFWSSVAYGNGKFVAVSGTIPELSFRTDANGVTRTYGDNSTIAAYSTDGINWTEVTMPISARWSSIAYGDGKFVAVANQSPYFAVSDDGVNWTTQEMFDASWSSITYGENGFLAIAYDSNKAVYSYHLSEYEIAFMEVELPVSAEWTSVTYGNGKYVAVSKNKITAVSTDCVNWIQSEYTTYLDVTSVVFGNGKFVAVGSSGGSDALYSADGIVWNDTKLPSGVVHAVSYGDGKFVAVYDNGKGAFSYDGINWTYSDTPKPNGENYSWQSVAYGNGKFVSIAARIYPYTSRKTNYAAYTSGDIKLLNMGGCEFTSILSTFVKNETKKEIDVAFGSQINEIDVLIGGDT